jgi:hypothetical protein
MNFKVTTAKGLTNRISISPTQLTNLRIEHCVGLHFINDGLRRLDFQFHWAPR